MAYQAELVLVHSLGSSDLAERRYWRTPKLGNEAIPMMVMEDCGIVLLE